MTAAGEESGGRRRGRPTAGDSESADRRTRILRSARAEFAERGYDKASVRAIARGADVDPALVHHYFGTKERVFEAALETALAPVRGGLGRLPEVPPEELGPQVTRFVLGVWEDPSTRDPLLAIVRSAVSNETAAAIFRGVVTRLLLPRLTGALDGPDRELRAELAVAQLVGTAMLRYVIRVEPLASADPETLVDRLAPVVQHHLTAPDRK
ncbi:TetR/AcrR family transcriptional regulator [Streptomyces alkaliterrae]|uniref:TetR family transcriptional regulator n=1 Tax=Streptomyces alkaliterrae TaxID=2213162 RepID=A0A5P0YY10_9ACTN|nr:TetR family transcriptional regulator [Streptomyces alkaliterrae]MBB1255914.1 TetR/AcrR family transcriptional regulator [Streptomyces alkaliterrae]MBB1257587.1 TetR/AcrR family transcriptional regulator [Streptomyces alkaliterrae]MQS03379.1 TetR family transcriptional regulator [Streptomyces alkaliterrae]